MSLDAQRFTDGKDFEEEGKVFGLVVSQEVGVLIEIL
jgi:hypothetical protein